MLQILPYVELQARYDDILSQFGTLTPWTAQFKHSTFLCPSDRNKNMSNRHLNYVGCRGDLMVGYRFDPGDVRGVFRQGCGWSGQPGSCEFAAISDGLSNTLLWSEAAMAGTYSEPTASPFQATNLPLKGFLVTATLDSGAGTYPADCAAKYSLGTMITPPATAEVYSVAGINMFDGAGYKAVFYAMLPPNYPSCAVSADYAAMEGYQTIHTASSYHPGGVNASMADASVRFFSSTINPGDILTDISTLSGVTSGFPSAYSGPSFWGVWGALGTTAGSESKTVE
jgi:prepilin-type processing-associated H-X9-DG protein